MPSRLVIFCVCLKVLSVVETASVTLPDDAVNRTGADEKSDASTKISELEESLNLFNNDNVSADGNSKSDSNERITVGYELSTDLGSFWPNIPLLPVAYATSSSMPDGSCKSQAHRYLEGLKNETLWAVQMYEASTKYPGGIISGYTRDLGDFDLCYNLKATLPRHDVTDLTNNEEIVGRYCLVNIRYEKQGLPPVNASERHELEFDPHGSVWEAIREKGDFRRIKRYVLEMALCVPEVCTTADIEAALQEPFRRAGLEHNVIFNVTVDPKLSQAQTDAPEFPLGGKIYCSLLAVLILLVVLSTWYDFSLGECNEKDGTAAEDFVLCFSARRNYNSLMEITTSYEGLQTIHLVRFFFMSLVVFGHRIMEYYAAPVVNLSYMERLYEMKISMFLLAGTQLVEGFFAIGGLLVCYHLLEQLDKTKKLNFLPAIMMRFLRLTPTYALVVLFYILVLPYIGSGPYWELRVGVERDRCSNYWWANLLYINNYVDTTEMCMFQTWYVSVDFQLFILALLVVYAFWRMPRKIGYPFLCLVIVGGCVVPFVLTYSYGVQPVWKGLLQYRDLREVPYYTDHYVKTHERITSYFIGVLAGAVIYDHKQNPWHMNEVVSKVLFFLFGLVFSLGSELSAGPYYDPNDNPKGLEAAFYACLHRGAFAISCCALIVLPTVGRGLKSQYNFLTPKWAQPLGRLTYTAYLVHYVPQIYTIGVTRIARRFGIGSLLWGYVPEVVHCFFVSFLISLIVEGPFRRLEKRFMSIKKTSKMSNGIDKKAKKSN